jgi:ketosteroid isomerase-like protein
MMRLFLAILTALVSWLVGPVPEQVLAPDLRAMIDTEREFARTARVKGIRDAFLEFFAEDSIVVGAEPRSAKDGLRKRPPQPFSIQELVWEPRVGDIAASGELGWLSGPSTFVNHSNADPDPRYGNYLSIWRKQPDGTWRVFIDMGTNTPEPVAFAPGFVRVASASRFAAAGDLRNPELALADADRALNDDASSRGLSAAYAARLLADARLQREGAQPIVGREAIALWLASHPSPFSGRTCRGESARSGDLGYTFGSYRLSGDTSQDGSYLRVWSRDGDGRWWLVVDVAQPAS